MFRQALQVDLARQHDRERLEGKGIVERAG